MVSAAQSNLITAALLPAQVDSQVSYAMLAKTNDAARQEGANMVDLINSANDAAPSSAQAGDPLVAQATGLGGILDTTA